MTLLQSFINNQLLQNLNGDGPQIIAPASNNKGKWSEKNLALQVTLEFSNSSSHLLLIKNLSNGDLAAVPLLTK